MNGPSPKEPPANAPATDALAASAGGDVELGRAPITVEIPLSDEANRRLLARAGEPGILRLVIEGLTLLRPGVHYEVYLNLPAGSPPQPSGPHFLGHLALFAEPGTGEVTRGFDIGETVQALARQDLWTRDARVTLVPAQPREELESAPGSGPFFRFRRIAIVER